LERVTAPRYRCSACGNLTRFDVTATRTTRAFHHYSVGGDLEVEEEVVLLEILDEVSCRWCGHGRAVEEIDPGGIAEPTGADLAAEATHAASATRAGEAGTAAR
jgi:hypothetical protein